MSSELEQSLTRMREKLDGIRESIGSIDALEGTAASENGLVEATVKPGGTVVDLQISPRAMRMQSFDLRDSILEAIRNATEAANQKLGDSVGCGQQILDDILREDPSGFVAREVAEIRRTPESLEQMLGQIRSRYLR